VKQRNPIWEENQAKPVTKVCLVKVASESGKRLEAQLDNEKDCSPEEGKV